MNRLKPVLSSRGAAEATTICYLSCAEGCMSRRMTKRCLRLMATSAPETSQGVAYERANGAV